MLTNKKYFFQYHSSQKQYKNIQIKMFFLRLMMVSQPEINLSWYQRSEFFLFIFIYKDFLNSARWELKYL